MKKFLAGLLAFVFIAGAAQAATQTFWSAPQITNLTIAHIPADTSSSSGPGSIYLTTAAGGIIYNDTGTLTGKVITGLVKSSGSSGPSAAVAGTDYEVPLTFSTGLTRTTNTITVNSTQNISKLSNLTSNGFVKTSGGDGTLSVDTASYVPTTRTVAGQALSSNVTIACGDLTNAAASCSTDTTVATNISSGVLAAARGGAGTSNGILKANGSGLVSAATSGTDYAPATSGTSILYGDGSGGFSNVTIGSNISFAGGVLSASGGGGSPGGSAGAIQYNSGGTAFAGAGTMDAAANLSGLGTVASGAHTITSTSANALAVGANGTTNPSLQVDASTASAANGLKITSTAAGSGVTLGVISGGSNDSLTVSAKGSGSVSFITTTGSVLFRPAGNTVSTYAQNTLTFAPVAAASGASDPFTFTVPASTGQTAGSDLKGLRVNCGATRTHASNTTIALDSCGYFDAPTFAFATAGGTITNGATIRAANPVGGTNATMTNSSAILVETASLTNVTNGYGINVNAPTSATNNWAARINGNITLEGTAPSVSSCGGGTIATGSTNHKGRVTGITTATACTITFSSPLATAPACVFSSNNAITPTVGSISTSAVTTAMTALTGTLYYICF